MIKSRSQTRQSMRKAVFPLSESEMGFAPETRAMPENILRFFDSTIIQDLFDEAVFAGIIDLIVVMCRPKQTFAESFGAHTELERSA